MLQSILAGSSALRIASICLLLSAFLAGCSERPEPADLILVNGKLVTVDEATPEAQALAAREGVIVAVGSTAEIERYRGPDTEVIDLGGKLAIPGFIEGHAHFTGLGRSLMIVELRTARTWEEVVERVAGAVAEAEPGEWISGRGWHQEKWDAAPEPAVEGYPTHELLSRAAPDNPVMLRHASGHASMVNAKAMELAGITAASPDPPGGKILRDAGGRPTGLLRETADDSVAEALARSEAGRSAEQIEALARKEIELASEECLSKGVTSFQDAGSSFKTIERIRAMAEEGRLGPRLWVMIGEGNDRLEQAADGYPIVGAAGGMLTVRAIKRSFDGALGSHGAWLLEPYSDLPETVGLNTIPVASLEEAARIAIDHGLQLCVHAIGDRANREALDVFERAFDANPDKKDLRWRVEHAQHLDPGDIPRFAALGVVASMQGIHCTSDGPWVPQRLGEERAAEGAYMWRALLDSGAIVSNGTDAPVEDVDPIASFYASVTRRMADGREFYAEQRMSREEALRSYTISAAHAAFEEEIKGSLTEGKLADVTVLSRDIMTVPEEEILDAEVVFTIVGGKVAYRSPGSQT
jgi:predicted amidohydrolase YtcJ